MRDVIRKIGRVALDPRLPLETRLQAVRLISDIEWSMRAVGRRDEWLHRWVREVRRRVRGFAISRGRSAAPVLKEGAYLVVHELKSGQP